MKKSNVITAYICLLILLIASGILCIFLGSVSISLDEILVKGSVSNSIVFGIRFPRMLAAIFTGGALAIAGYCLQTFFHNPVAGPYLLGISSGAKLTVALMLVYLAGSVSSFGSFAMIIVSFAGAMIAMGFVLLVSRYVGNMSMLLVCGVMIGYICTAICDLVVTFADDSDIVNLHNWSRGSLSGIRMEQALIMGGVILATSLLVFFLSKPMSAFMISESYAKSVGVNLSLFKVLLVLLSSLLAATVTAFAGPVSFVGIAVPHLLKVFLKTNKPVVLIPACFLGGAVFTCICDLIARTVFSPTELSISTVTAIFGAPVVVVMLIKRSRV